MAYTVTHNPAPRTDAQRAEILANPGFGKFFTDHMVQIEWATEGGWGPMQVVPYGPLALDPSTNSLHYGQLIFEGLKAYRHGDGTIKSFRPEANAKRFAKSAARLAMPELPESMFLESLEALLSVDAAWVPDDREKSLYLRPFMIATEAALGVRPANRYLYLLIASPAGAYFPRGVQPVTVWLSAEYVRAAEGGTGEAKCAGNYAASLVAQMQAAQQGCDQVVWLDAIERRWIEEMGGMNMYFVFGNDRIMTPQLTGTLLPGVTRDSLLTVAADLGLKAEEGRISKEQWRDLCASGQITETFACGTAAVITPVGAVKSAEGEWTVGDGQPGPVTMKLRQALLDIQTGVAQDSHHWMRTVGKA